MKAIEGGTGCPEGKVIGMTDLFERDQVWRAGILRDRLRDEGKVGWTSAMYEWLMTKTLVMTEMILRSSCIDRMNTTKCGMLLQHWRHVHVIS